MPSLFVSENLPSVAEFPSAVPSYNMVPVTAPSNQWLKFTIIAVIGVFSGLLTAEASRFLHPANPLIGIIFGISIIALLWLQHKADLSRVVAALLIFSVVSYLAAVWVTLPLYSTLGRFLRPELADDPFGPVVFTFAGYLGALIINAALLEKLKGLSGSQALAKAASWACGGAILGFIAEELSGPVGAAVAKIVGDPPSREMGSNDYFLVFYSAYVIWQTGMLFLITFMISRGEPSPAATQATTGQTRDSPRI